MIEYDKFQKSLKHLEVQFENYKTLLEMLKRYLLDTVVWAYGSRVKWTSHPESDLDMVVFSSPDQKNQVSYLKEALEESDLPFRVDVFEWDEVSEGFRKNIEAEHVVLQEQSERSRVIGSETLEGIAEIVMGQSPSSNAVSDDKVGSPLLNGPTEFGPYHPVPVQFTTDAKKRGLPGDILFCVRGSTTGRMNWADREYAIGRGLAAIRHRESLELQPYVRAVIEYGLSDLLAQATGSTFPNVSATQLKAVSFPKLEKTTQHAIAHILGSLDDKIELNRQMNRTLEKMAQAIFKSWFIDFDPVKRNRELRRVNCENSKETFHENSSFTIHHSKFDSLFPDSFEDSEIGEIPSGWEVLTVKAGFDLTMGQSPPGSTYNENGNGLPFFQGRRDFGFRYPTKRVYCTEPKRLANVGDTLISVRAPVGDINMAYEHCCVGRGVAAVRHKSGSCSFTYYSMCALGERFSRFEGEGTVFGSINKKQFDGLPYIAPVAKIIEQFENFVGSLDENVRINTEEIRCLVSLRNTLLPKLISGELTIPDAEKLLGGLNINGVHNG